jgi:hypothetical protein
MKRVLEEKDYFLSKGGIIKLFPKVNNGVRGKLTKGR